MDELAAFGLDSAANAGDIYAGDPYGSTALGVPTAVSSIPMLPGDIAEQQQMAPWNPAPVQSDGTQAPWWAGIAAYGIGRAIDNTFPSSPTGISGNTYPGSGAGMSGRTYSQRPTAAGGGVTSANQRAGLQQLLSGGSGMTWLLLAGAAFLLLR